MFKSRLIEWLPVVLVLAGYVAIYFVGADHARNEYKAKIAELHRQHAEQQTQQALIYADQVSAAQKKMQAYEEKANQAAMDLALAQNQLKQKTNTLQKEVIYVTQKDKSSGDTCDAFSPDGLQLYKSAFGYPAAD
ncbi:hypothetical protein [Neisseria sp. Ec49-e6-T10]|uniref:hypothetical protein n=1 Tax=Neisseria sp. Ec49-e6-T10 TaxID=3140744 RepID=UPI003EC15008